MFSLSLILCGGGEWEGFRGGGGDGKPHLCTRHTARHAPLRTEDLWLFLGFAIWMFCLKSKGLSCPQARRLEVLLLREPGTADVRGKGNAAPHSSPQQGAQEGQLGMGGCCHQGDGQPVVGLVLEGPGASCGLASLP